MNVIGILNNMSYPYDTIEKLNPDLKNHKYIGGFEDENDIFLWYRENGEKKIVKVFGVPRYFCINKGDQKKAKKLQWDTWKDMGLYEGGYFNDHYGYIISKYTGYKSNWNNWLTTLHEMGIEPLEGDISRLQRLVIDLELQIANPNDETYAPKVCFWDIETDDRKQQIDAGNDYIVSVAVKDQQTGDEKFFIMDSLDDESEKKMLLEFYKYISEFDVRIGFNSFGFDDICVDGRLKYHGIDDKKWRRICSIDLYNQFERQGTFNKFNSKNRKLDTIAKAVIGRGKIPHNRKTFDLWTNDKQLLKDYNMEDIRLLYDMEKVLSTANLVMTQMSFSGIPYNISHSPLRLVESFLLRQAVAKRKNGILDYRFGTSYYLPEHNLNKDKYSPFSKNSLASDKRKGRKEALEEMGIEYEEITGGFVLESEPAFCRNVTSFDFNSLYPSVIIAFNICYSTLVDENYTGDKNKTPDGTWFRTDRVGLMPSACDFLLNERKKIRGLGNLETDPIKKNALDILQMALKILANSIYGVCGLYGSRLFNNKIGNAITSFGRFAIPLGDEYFTSSGRKVVIGDTDSIYVTNKDGDNPEELKDSYVKLLRETIKEKYNTYRPDVLKMSYEKYFKILLVLKKKIYSGLASVIDGVEKNPPERIIKGLKLVKSDTCKFASTIAKQVLQDVLEDKYDAEHFINIIKNAKDNISNGRVKLSELIISSRLGKETDEYINDNPSVYVKIAKRMKENGFNVPSHSTINYVITDSQTPMDGMSEDEVEESVEIDAVYYFNKQLLGIIKPILEIVFEEIDWKEYEFPRKLKKTNYFELKVKINK